MSHGLAIPSAVIPKPTKTELIAALLERAKVKCEQENAINTKKRDELKKKIYALAEKEMKKSQTPYNRYIYAGGKAPSVELVYRISTPEIEKLAKELDAIPRRISFDPAKVKRTIRESLATGGQRANPLLQNKDAVKSLDAFVAEMKIA